MRTWPFLVAALCLFGAARMHATTLTYSTDGCGEYIVEQSEGDPNHAPTWRTIYKCCGSSCFLSTDWTSQIGPVHLCGMTIYPSSGGSGQIHYNGQGGALVDVPPGHGGVISFNPSTTCQTFTPDGSAVIVIPYEMLAL
jgi:hypothetical protein